MHLDITCSTDDNYIQHCSAMLCSVFENNKEHDITVHLLHHGLSSDSQSFLVELANRYGDTILFYDIDLNRLGEVTVDEHWHPTLSIASYYRLLLASLLDESIEKVFYLDCDVIVLGDVSPLFKLDLSGYGVAAVEDTTPGNDQHRQTMGLNLNQTAFCAGVLMVNLKYWRRFNCEEHLLDYAQRMAGQLVMEDQDVLNHEFRGHWFKLPYKYMRTPMAIASLDKQQKWADIEEYVFHPVIIHYAAHVKPWLDIPIPDGKYYWEYVKRSGFPNPKVIKTLPQYRRPIRMAKVRYYLNAYIHPFVPDIVEIILRDLVDILVGFSYSFRPSAFKAYRIRRWLRKYK
jgi:lipopolysaccharide biosynthesis glycosyltransferase